MKTKLNVKTSIFKADAKGDVTPTSPPTPPNQ